MSHGEEKEMKHTLAFHAEGKKLETHGGKLKTQAKKSQKNWRFWQNQKRKKLGEKGWNRESNFWISEN